LRQANSAIRGFLYQFDKSLLEILNSNDGQVITLEGQIEDIDIVTDSSIETIQCKYHEDKDFAISSVAEPILDMFCHFIENPSSGKKIKYVLYAYFNDNVESIQQSDFNDYIMKATNKDTILKYFHRLFHIEDEAILNICNKTKRTDSDKKQIVDYFNDEKNVRKYKTPIGDFFVCFEYRKAEKHSVIKARNVKLLQDSIDDGTTAFNLYYPNAFSKIAMMSSLPDIADRKITKRDLLEWLLNQKSFLINKWIFEIEAKGKVLKQKKSYLSQTFSGNSHVRAFVFSSAFLRNNADNLNSFFIEYVNKYYWKKRLQRPPIFILDATDMVLLNFITENLYTGYKMTINNGYVVVDKFSEDCFINNTNCAADFSMKITLAQNIDSEMLQRCGVNYLYYVGSHSEQIHNSCFRTESLGISTISELRYLVKLDLTLMEGTQ